MNNTVYFDVEDDDDNDGFNETDVAVKKNKSKKSRAGGNQNNRNQNHGNKSGRGTGTTGNKNNGLTANPMGVLRGGGGIKASATHKRRRNFKQQNAGTFGYTDINDM